MLVDSHCHLDRLDLTPYEGDLQAALAAATERGVEGILCIGIDRSNATTVVELAQRYPQVWASVGIHPLDLADDVESVAALCELGQSLGRPLPPKVALNRDAAAPSDGGLLSLLPEPCPRAGRDR